MRTLIYKILPFLLLGLIISGCVKEEHSQIQNTTKTQLPSKPKNNNDKSIVIEVNENNPFDYVGVYHNILLYDLTNNYTYSSNLEEMEDEVKVNTGIVFNYYFPNDTLIDLDILNEIPNMEGFFHEIDFENYHAIFENLLPQDYELFNGFIEECISYENQFTDENISDILIDIENDYIDNKGGNFDSFYCFAAIFRYSVIYQFELNQSQKLSRWWKKAIGDAAGGVAGFFFGGGLGALQGAAAGTTIAHFLWE